MHILIANFNLKDVGPDDFATAMEEGASAFAAIPGLISKVYLADAQTNTYGGIYSWQDEQAMEDFMAGELWHFVETHPNVANLTWRDFGILEGPSRVTRGLAEVAAA